MDTNKGWWVALSGMGLNLAVGVLYAWSVFSKQLTEAVDKGGFGWSKTEASIPYTVAIACFALMMVPAGRLQDKIGPRMVASMGAVFTAAGLALSSFASAPNILPVPALLFSLMLCADFFKSACPGYCLSPRRQRTLIPLPLPYTK